jgi:hypothetical protein
MMRASVCITTSMLELISVLILALDSGTTLCCFDGRCQCRGLAPRATPMDMGEHGSRHTKDEKSLGREIAPLKSKQVYTN